MSVASCQVTAQSRYKRMNETDRQTDNAIGQNRSKTNGTTRTTETKRGRCFAPFRKLGRYVVILLGETIRERDAKSRAVCERDAG